MIKNNGVTLISMVIIIIVLLIITSISIIGGTELLKNAKDTRNEETLSAIQAVVNRIHLKIGTAGVFTPGNSEFYGKIATDILSGDEDILKDWYILERNDLEEMGIEDFEDSYIVNYKANQVVSMTTYRSNGIYALAGDDYVPKASNSIASKINQGLLQVGDFVNYNPDPSNRYKILSENTGTYSYDGEIFSPEDVMWRVWSIDENNNIVIVPSKPVNYFALEGDVGFVNSLDILEDICDMYTNSSLGVTADKVRSMKIEDVEDTNVSSNLMQLRNSYFIKYGTTNAELNGDNGFTGSENRVFVEEDGVTITKTPRIPSKQNPVIVRQTQYFANNIKWQPISNDKISGLTYGNLLGSYESWLASPCTNCTNTFAYLCLKVINNKMMAPADIYETYGNSTEYEFGVRPMVTINPNVIITNGDGKTTSTSWEF